MSKPDSKTLTIGRLATAAHVNIETVRYYQQRGLLPVPPAKGAFRHYPIAMVDRIRFIKRAQELGFTLVEIAELLQLDEKIDRQVIRNIANNKFIQIQQKIADLTRMQNTLQHLVEECHDSTSNQTCPIIASLSIHH